MRSVFRSDVGRVDGVPNHGGNDPVCVPAAAGGHLRRPPSCLLIVRLRDTPPGSGTISPFQTLIGRTASKPFLPERSLSREATHKQATRTNQPPHKPISPPKLSAYFSTQCLPCLRDIERRRKEGKPLAGPIRTRPLTHARAAHNERGRISLRALRRQDPPDLIPRASGSFIPARVLLPSSVWPTCESAACQARSSCETPAIRQQAPAAAQ